MKYLYKIFKRIVFVILLIIVVYLLVSVLLSFIPVNNNFQNRINSNYEIWIKSNGVHLDIILPIKNNLIDWDAVLSVPAGIKDKVQYVGFGWGDKEFYINTPQWSDLKFPTAFKALFVRTDAAMHVAFYWNLSENEKTIKLYVNEQQFTNTQIFIMNSFKTKEDKVILIENIEYGVSDRFYEANYKYSLFYTCNSWTNEILKKGGLPACVWTPFDKGILFQIREYN